MGKKTGPNPTDRSKLGVKRSILTDAKGIPLSIEIEGTNVHDIKLFEQTLNQIKIQRPVPSKDVKHHLCLDAGYDALEIWCKAINSNYCSCIRARDKEKELKQKNPEVKPRRWVVERTHSWLNRFRRILIRWEKKPNNYLSFLHLACALICFRSSLIYRIGFYSDK